MKIKLNEIPISHLKTYMELAWMGDNDLIEKYHIIAPATLDACIEHTLGQIRQWGTEYGMRYYSVEMERGMHGQFSMIGFTVLIDKPKMLYSFGIRPLYREREILQSWLDAVKVIFGGEHFTVPLWEKNERGINFFRKNGFNNTQEQDKFVLLWQ